MPDHLYTAWSNSSINSMPCPSVSTWLVLVFSVSLNPSTFLQQYTISSPMKHIRNMGEISCSSDGTVLRLTDGD